MSFSIVIPSCNLTNLTACIHAIRAAGETARIIAVWHRRHEVREMPGALDADFGPEAEPLVKIVAPNDPWCFAAAANAGINAALKIGDDDVLLCNDDALLETPKGFTAMSYQWPDFGILSARVRGTAHPVHQISKVCGVSNDITRVGGMVPFVCVLIRRALIDRIGMLDTRFVPGGFEDDDYCRRAHDAGSLVGCYNGTVVDHERLPHTFRPDGKPQLYDLNTNRARFNEKWGIK
jgi:GT2 family glycosyltransferase